MIEAAIADQFKSWSKQDKTLALIAGEGKLPSILAKSAKERGYKVVALSITKDAHTKLAPIADVNIQIAPGQILRNFNIMKQHGCNGVVFIGKVSKLVFLKNIANFDWMAVRELFALANLNDDSIQFRIGHLLEERGMPVLSQSQFLRELFPDVGVLTKRQPNVQEYADIEYGMKLAKEIARLDIGQTVIVRERTLLAVEAIEGTDEAIKRAVHLAGKKPVVVCKVSKPNQDQRFDIPAVGLRTLNAMSINGGGGVLAIEANETMVIDQEELVAAADQRGMTVVAV